MEVSVIVNNVNSVCISIT